MKSRGLFLVIFAVGILITAETCARESAKPLTPPPEALDMNLSSLSELAATIRTMEYIPGDPGVLVYGTGRGFLYLYKISKGKMRMAVKTNLWKGIKRLTLADLDMDGKPEVLALTKEAMLYALDLDRLEIIWSTEEGYFEGIACFTVADLARDGENEIIILADNHLFIFDIGSGYERWKSLEEHEAVYIVAGDVDDDGMMEMVLSNGSVLDSRLYEEEWFYDEAFGPQMDLFDIDGDGVVEVISLDGAGDLQIVDVDDRSRQWR